jgi:mRNA-degrading endonuclease RelE of RelBE toxin-antitoxin system
MKMKVLVENEVVDYIKELPAKDQKVIGEHINRLIEHPKAIGDIKRMITRTPRWRMHISSKYTVFYFVKDDTVYVDRIMTQEQAHKKYGIF